MRFVDGNQKLKKQGKIQKKDPQKNYRKHL